MNFHIQELEKGFTPIKFNKHDAGFDVMSRIDITIGFGEIERIPLGFKIFIPKGWVMKIVDRSSIVMYTTLRVEDSPGIIDSGYIEEIECTIKNINHHPNINKNDYEKSYEKRYVLNGFRIKKYDRIAQVLFEKINKIELVQCNDIKDVATHTRTIRNGKSGYGSTGL